jgi:6,7-dimethyl-8-ribityllumazine synthase
MVDIKRPRLATTIEGARVLIIEARFYEDIAAQLLMGARQAIDEAKAHADVLSVPGALEIPIALALALDEASRQRQAYDGAVALGCIIRGETYHFEIVANESARALMDLAVARSLPLGNAILTVENAAQAAFRADLTRGDKGGEAARAAITLIALKRRLGGT